MFGKMAASCESGVFTFFVVNGFYEEFHAGSSQLLLLLLFAVTCFLQRFYDIVVRGKKLNMRGATSKRFSIFYWEQDILSYAS